MKIPLLITISLSSLLLNAQYYYNDIVATQEKNKQMQIFLGNKVKTVSAVGYTPQGSKATDFSETQELLENGKTLKVSGIVSLNISVLYNRFNADGRLVNMLDSTAGVESVTTYEYDKDGKIIKIENRAKDKEEEFTQVETHIWVYSPDGRVQKMWRIKNGNDSLELNFTQDENGCPGEEISYKNGHETDHVYYYYDERKRLTDIVRYNKKVKKLMPEIIFSYDDSDRVIQKIISSEEDNYGLGKYGNILYIRYLIWRYIYNGQGLKTKEALFNKDQEMTGKIEYRYTFN